ncbi:MAG: glycosyltransferase family 2 protein [Endomicrobiales bacterium]|nr:glycosyltransferase family 2 protein [Endomicrobiales bacterium]
MKTSVLIPVYNEKNYIEKLIGKVRARPEVSEILVVDDGSVDGTREILKRLAAGDKRIRLVCREKNSGKGAAIREGIGVVSGDVVIIQDADLEYDPDEYPKLLEPFEKIGAKVVYGSRTLSRKNRYSVLSFALGGVLLTILTDLLYLTFITDEPTGYKVFKTDIIKSITIESDGFEFCPEVTAKILKKGIKIAEVPISYNPRKFSEGKKIKVKDGFIAIWTLLKYRFWK